MAKKKGRSRNYVIPAPAWFIAAVNKIRESGTDEAMLAKIAEQTGHIYSRPVLSRYCDGSITTLQLTEDLYKTYRVSHGLGRPFVIAQTSDDATRIAKAIADAVESGAAEVEGSLPETRTQGSDARSRLGVDGSKARKRPMGAGGSTAPSRRS
jgi:hypothetical protein